MLRTIAVIAALSTASAVLSAAGTHAAVPSAPATGSEVQPVDHLAKAGYAPQWVQYPYLSKGGNGKLTVVAKVFVDPKRMRATKSLRQDRLRMRVAVGMKKYTKVSKPRSVEVLPDSALLVRTHQTRKVAKVGVMTLKVPLSRSVSDKVRNREFAGRRAAFAVSLSHRKDTAKGGSPHEVIQINAGRLVKEKWSKRKVQRITAGAIEQRQMLRRSTVQGAQLTGGSYASQLNPNTPFFNNINVNNNSPFQQQVTFQPVIQCMYAATASAPPPAAVETANAGDTLTFTYGQHPNWRNGKSRETPTPNDPPLGLYGAEKGLNAPGTQGTLMTDLVNSGNVAGQQAVNSAFNPRTYTGAGIVGAVAAASVRFVVSFLLGLKVDTCNDTSQYPQLFGVSTAVTGFGTNGVSDPTQADWPPTNTWAGNPAAGNQGAFTDTPSSGFINGALQQALGAQTNVMYYWNGGAPAPMVSPNASSKTYTGGSATFQDGLIQYVGPNPGFPDGVAVCEGNQVDVGPYYCNYGGTNEPPLGQMDIQLSYLTNPDYSAGLLNDGAAPIMNASVDSTGDYTLTCDLSQMNAALTTPFGNGAPTTVEQSTLASTVTNGSGQLPQNADWLVNFFGVTADGQPVYIEESVTGATNGVNTPYLAPNASNQPVSIQAASSGGSQAIALGTVTEANLQNMVTPDGSPAVPAQFGCTASPTVSLPGLQVNTASGSPIATAYGNNWPVPTKMGAAGGWPAGYYESAQLGFPYGSSEPFDFKWQKPVSQLNVTFQGPPLGDVTAVPQG